MRYFVYNGSLGMTRAISVDTENNKIYFQFRDEGDSKWQHSISPSAELPDDVTDENMFSYVKKLAGNPFPVFMEFEGRSAEAFGLVRDTKALIQNY